MYGLSYFYSKNKIFYCDLLEINLECALINISLKKYSSLLGHQFCEDLPFQGIYCLGLDFNDKITHHEN